MAQFRFAQLWMTLPQGVRDHFEKVAASMDLKRGDLIYRNGDEPKGIYFVGQGLVGLVLTGVSGKEHLLRFFRQGQYFGHRSMFAEEPYHGSAVALEPTSIRLIPKQEILEVLHARPELFLEIIKVLSKELRRCEAQHVMILDHQILARTGQALVYLKDLHPEHDWTRLEIANFCASTPSTVIKALAELEGRGLIRQKGRRIDVLNRAGLIALSEEEP